MNREYGDEEGDGDGHAANQGFTCRLETVKTMTDVLTCLCVNTKKDHPCQIRATPEGLTFLVTGRSKTTQASAVLKAELFDEFICDTEAELALNLATLLECLLLFGASSDTTTATLTYSSEDAIFRLSLQDMGIMTSCDLTALQSNFDGGEGGLFTDFQDSPDEVAVLVESDSLKEAITEIMEVSGAGEVRISVSKANMLFSTQGSAGNICEISFPHDCKVFVLYRCDKPVLWTFPLSSLHLGMKALGVAKETYIRINAEGIMSIQHQIQGDVDTFVSFLVVALETPHAPLEDEGEEEGNGGEEEGGDAGTN
jgi:hypothetical protein